MMDDKFCRDDGTKLKYKKDPECPNCGYFRIGKFCSKCGVKFGKTEKKDKL